jgi:hypothetical protein
VVKQRIDPDEAQEGRATSARSIGVTGDPGKIRNGLLEIEFFHHSQYSGGFMDVLKVESLLDKICQTVGGDWLLVGGSLVQIEYDANRGTEDIDLVPISHPSFSDVKAQDELFKAAKSIGLDPENVNSAARFFVGEFQEWQLEVIAFREGPAGRIFRPTLALFVGLKLKRGTEIDLEDIRAAVRKEGRIAFVESRFREISDITVQAKFDAFRASLGL